MDGISEIEVKVSCPAWSRPGAVFIFALAVLLTALLIPFSQKLLDVLWLFSFCLSAAVIVICVLAKSSGDLIGFVPMLSGLSLLRLVAQGATSRQIIQNESGGFLLGTAGSALTASWPLGAMMVTLVLSVFLAAVIFAACVRMSGVSNRYLEQILPLKRMGIETDLRLGVIDPRQAELMVGRIVSESRFFSGIKGAGLLMRAEAAVCIVLLAVCLMIPSAGRSLNPASGTVAASEVPSLVVGLAVFTLFPAVAAAVAGAALMSKQTLTLGKEDKSPSGPGQVKHITVVDLDARAEEAGRTDPPHRSLPEAVDVSCRNATEYYEKLSRIICSAEPQTPVFLLASDKVNALPVTVPINIAIRLSQKGQKVLLVDTDPQRNAVANVFDLDPEAMKSKVIPSCLENLSVCSIPEGKLLRFLRQDKVLGRFDTTLIYAPQVPKIEPADGDAVKPGAFYFVDEKTAVTEQRAADRLAFCGWICMIPSIQSLLDG